MQMSFHLEICLPPINFQNTKKRKTDSQINKSQLMLKLLSFRRNNGYVMTPEMLANNTRTARDKVVRMCIWWCFTAPSVRRKLCVRLGRVLTRLMYINGGHTRAWTYIRGLISILCPSFYFKSRTL